MLSDLEKIKLKVPSSKEVRGIRAKLEEAFKKSPKIRTGDGRGSKENIDASKDI